MFLSCDILALLSFWGETNFPQPSPMSLLMSFHVEIIFGTWDCAFRSGFHLAVLLREL